MPSQDSPKALTLQRLWPVCVIAVLATFGLLRAWRLRWYCDDIFITFRYIDQLFAGNGFVFNPGEPVEGYSHFLWLMLIAGWRACGGAMLPGAMALGMASFAGILALAVAIDCRTRGSGMLLPLATAAVALNYDMALWATGGLETALAAMLVLLAFWSAFFLRANATVRFPFAGLVLALLAMTRPEGAMFWIVANGALAVGAMKRRAGMREALFLNLPFALIFGSYSLWRISFYGYLFPNTYYAKAAYVSDWGQGLYYVALHFAVYPSLALSLAVGVAALCLKDRAQDALSRAAFLTAFVAVVLYLVAFVAKVGGDYMFARFVAPVMPLTYVVGALGLRRILAGRSLRVGAIAWAVLLLLETPWRFTWFPSDSDTIPHGMVNYRLIVDERWLGKVYSPGFAPQVEVGDALAKGMKDVDYTLVTYCACTFAFHSKAPRVIESHGLTDRFIAHQDVPREVLMANRTGHKKIATAQYLSDQHVDFLFFANPYPLGDFQEGHFTTDGGTYVRFWIVTYDQETIAALAKTFTRGFYYKEFGVWFDRWIRETAPNLSREELQKTAEQMRLYYFSRNEDPTRDAALRELLKSRDGERP